MARFLGLLIATLSVCLQAVLAQNAFSGAVGFGAIATGGNSGSTVHVTNLADSGTGSFRDAVSGSNRNIVFDVAGYIVLKSAVSLSSSITINGQTAPGGGIGLMGAEISASGKSNIIIRNLRMRQGTMDSDTGKSAFNMGDAKNVILDHCSFAYGQFDSIDAVGAVNITVSNSIIAFPIGQQFGAHVETGPSTFYGNLWVSAHNRQPLSKDNTQYVNNIVYNYQAAYTSANTGGYFSHDIINNYFIAGPSTSSAGDDYYQMDNKQSVYATGNFLDSNKDGALNGAAANSVGSAVVLSKPWASTSLGLATNSAAAAVTSVLANAGATPRDEVDTFAVNTVKSYGKSGTIYKSQADTGLSNGGYGTLTATSTKKRAVQFAV
ncbi:polysaccharide lyase family 1 protein [Viridothelium virens]|uniref:Polysaccharide lyase family 1 protein n=1 Tax=Viridothelium virens TaxID=1048519 RepID=A0A6A6H4M1_VIRVR|nr:polysaccharide lyase family 1 protein [Viridothelium virens]